MKAQSVLRGSLLLMASALIAKLLGAVYRIPLTAALGGTGMGYYSCAYGLFLPIFALSVTGINTAVAALTARYAGEGRLYAAERVIRLAGRLFCGIGLIGAAALYLSADALCTDILKCPKAALSVRCFAPAVWFCCMNAVLRGEAEGQCSMTPTAVSQVAEGIGRVVCGLGLCLAVLRHPDAVLRYLPPDTAPEQAAAAAAILGVTLSTVTGTAVMLLMRRRRVIRISGLRAAAPADRVLLRELFAILLPVSAASLVTNLTALIDTATAVSLLTKAPGSSYTQGMPASDAANFLYGAYSGLAVTVCNLVPSVTNMLGKGVLPAFSGAYAANDRSGIREQAEAVMQRTAFLACPAGLGISALAAPVLHVLFAGRTAEANAAAPPLALLGISVIFTALSFPLFSMMQAAGAGGSPVRAMLAGALCKLTGNLILIPRFGLCGAAGATVLSCAVILVLAAAGFRRNTGIALHWLSLLSPPLFSGLLCAAAAAFTCRAVNAKCGLFPALTAAVCTGGLCYLAAYALIRPIGSVSSNGETGGRSISVKESVPASEASGK